MQSSVSTGTITVALAIMMLRLETIVDARPMHAAIIPNYHNYLAEKDQIATELEKWKKLYRPEGSKIGYFPVTESRSADEEIEDQLQRFYMTKQQIVEAREANPFAVFGTEGPFTLMTMGEFQDFLSNRRINSSNSTQNKTDVAQYVLRKVPSHDNVSISFSNNGYTRKRKREVPAPEMTTTTLTDRRLRDAVKTQDAFDENNYGPNEGKSFDSTPDIITPTYPPSGDVQAPYRNDAATKVDTKREYIFGELSKDDGVQIAGVSDGGGSSTSTGWWGTNGWGVNDWWNNNGWGGNSWWSPPAYENSNAGTYSDQSIDAPALPNSPSFSNSQWTSSLGPLSDQWVEPTNSGKTYQAPVIEALPHQTPTPARASAPAPRTDRPASPPVALAAVPVPAPVPAPALAPNPGLDLALPPVSLSAAATVSAPAPVRASTSVKQHERSVVGSSKKVKSSGAVDWSTSGCVNVPALQGQCASCWAFTTVAALEAVQCIHNGDKKAPTYSKQQLVSCVTKNSGCNGGASMYALEYVRENGICTESSYGYTSVKGGRPAACAKSCKPIKTGMKGIEQITAGDESTLLHVLKQHPVMVSVTSNNPIWKQYVSGVITSCPNAQVDHSVLVVGYDDTTFKIKNSWGTDWGEDGYVRMRRSSQGMGTCGILTDMEYPKF